MKKLLTLAGILIASFANAQNIPDFYSNISDNDKKGSFLLSSRFAEYDQLISYTSDGYGAVEKTVYILAHKKNEQWEAFKSTVSYDAANTENTRKIRTKKIRLKENAADSIIRYFTQHNLWALTLDSLNCHEKKTVVDSIVRTIVVTRTDQRYPEQFEISANDQYRVLYCYQPEYFQQTSPVLQRQQFILCREKFLKLLLQ